MPIHTFGDSHSINGWKDCNGVIPHHIGPVLCYSFGKDKLRRCNISKFGVKDNDSVVFCFGEIDCRCHVHKHISANNTYQAIITSIVHNYANAIETNVANCKVKLRNICVYNVVPPVQKYNTEENAEYPYLGTDEERKQYVLYFNKLLQQMCIEHNWIYADVYDKYTDEDGFLNKALSDNNVHVRDGYHLREYVHARLL